MARIDLFKQALEEKRAVKVIAGIDNFDIENIKKVVSSAEKSHATAVDICAREDIIKEIRSMTDMPIFVSSIVPSELVRAVELGADAIELGNFDVLVVETVSFLEVFRIFLQSRLPSLSLNEVTVVLPFPPFVDISTKSIVWANLGIGIFLTFAIGIFVCFEISLLPCFPRGLNLLAMREVMDNQFIYFP